MDPAIVQDELPCAACGYLLRGLALDGRCPECNHAVRESIAAHANVPDRHRIFALSLAAILLGGVLLGWDHVWLYAYSHRVPELSFYVNRDGVKYLLYGVLLLIPAWPLARPAARGIGRTRLARASLALPLALLGLAALMFVLINYSSTPGSVVLLSSYMLAPFACAVELIVLFALLAHQVKRLPARPPRTVWLHVAGWLVGGVMLVDSLAWSTINGARILQRLGLMTKPNSNRYIPDWCNVIVQPVFRLTGATMTPARYLAAAVGIGYGVAIFRRRRRDAVGAGAAADAPVQGGPPPGDDKGP